MKKLKKQRWFYMTKEQRRDELLIQDMIEAIDHTFDFVKNVTRDEFENNYEKQSAIIRQFEIIGEAATKISNQMKQDNREIEWKDIIGMRNKMIHDYFEINLVVVWDTVRDDLPKYKSQIEKILEKL